MYRTSLVSDLPQEDMIAAITLTLATSINLIYVSQGAESPSNHHKTTGFSSVQLLTQSATYDYSLTRGETIWPCHCEGQMCVKCNYQTNVALCGLSSILCCTSHTLPFSKFLNCTHHSLIYSFILCYNMYQGETNVFTVLVHSLSARS